jgi:hypothetical protein
VGVGGFLGGVEWGMASDGTRLYVANADVLSAASGRDSSPSIRQRARISGTPHHLASDALSSGTLADGMLFVGSGYFGNLGGSTSDVLLAFSVDGR